MAGGFEVDVPDIGVVEFPEGTTEDEAKAAINQHLHSPVLTPTVVPGVNLIAPPPAWNKVPGGAEEFFARQTGRDVPKPKEPGLFQNPESPFDPIINVPGPATLLRKIGERNPILKPLAAQFMEEHPVVTGLGETAAKTVSGFTSPAMIATAAAAPLLPAKLVGGAFSAWQGYETVKNFPKVKQTIEDPNVPTYQKWEAGGDEFASLAFTVAPLVGMTVAKLKSTMTPEQAANVLKEKLPSGEQPKPQPTTQEVPNAPQERQVQEGVQPERVGTDAQRVSAEASPGNIVQPAAEVRPQQPQPEAPKVPLTPPGVNPQAKEWLTHAAYEEPETGDVYTGANHPEILENMGIPGFETRESRNTPQFGFKTNLRPFVTREEAAKISEKSGQQLEPFEIGPKGEPVAHSDQTASPTEPGKTIAEQEPLNPGGALKDLPPELQKKSNSVKEAMRAEYEKLKAGARTVIDTSKDKLIGKNAAGESVYQRDDGSFYRMRFDRKDKPNGYPDFGGDLAVNPATQKQKSPTEILSTASQVKVKAPEGATSIRVTMKDGKSTVQSLSNVNKGENVFRGTDVAKIEAGTIGKDKKFAPMEGDVSVTPKVFPAGPGAATGASVESDIGAMESNIPPLEKLADAVKDFPKQEGSWKEALNQWLNDVGVPIKDFAGRALATAKAATARVIAAQHELPAVTSMDRAVGKWNLADTESDLAAQRFAGAVRKVFKDRSKLRALSNWIDASGDKELLRQRAEATKDPALRKTYEDASKFGPDEERLARDIQQYHDEMLSWAQREGALEEGLENYLHRYYKANDPVLEQKLAAVRYLRFTKDFSGFKKRFYASDFDAEQAGLSPEKDAARRILAYDQGFRKALTARAFVKDRYSATMKDGRPELDIAGMGVRLEPGEEGGRTVTLIKPKWKQNSSDPIDYRGDYVPFDHPAFRKHKWVSSDENGNPTLVQGDILVHPDAVKNYQALFGKSWWKTNPIGRALLAPSNVVKQTMLSLSAFHPVQIAIHAIEHKTNPFRLKDLNVRDPAQAELVEGGLTIADTSGSMAFSEGVASAGGLLGKIPIIGEQLRLSNDWLFKDFIPRIKMTMALDALERNQKRYSKELATGKITREQLVRLTAREANAAFGEQNYRAMFRNPTFQDTLRFLFLAPDFGEARLKFPLQALTKYGGEQRMALILGALGMATVAKLVERELTGQVNWKRPFTVTYKDREYGLRNVASDLYHLISDPGGYARNRLNPIYTRAALEALSGRDAFGRKRTASQQLLDEAKTIVPISTRGLTDREQRFWESFMNAMGLTERRRSSFSDAMKNVNDWKKKMGYENSGEFVYDADKDPYHPLTQELTFGSDDRALRELNKLIQGKSITERRKIYDHYQRALGRTRYLTGSKEKEREYVKTLKGEELLQYQDAIKERHEMYQRFQRVWNKRTINQP